MPLAAAIAMQSGITVHDAMYVAVAKIHEKKLLTADKKLVEALSRSEFKTLMLWLGA